MCIDVGNKRIFSIFAVPIANCTRLLLVADPQILGETFDEHVYNDLAIFDNDRFLRSTYGHAVAHVRPDAVAFLGDLMDEGSVASTEQYDRYLKRFRMIFSAQSADVPVSCMRYRFFRKNSQIHFSALDVAHPR